MIEDGVWPANAHTVSAFLSVCSQWIWVARPDGPAWTPGLDYAAVDVGLKLSGIELTPDQWRGLQLIAQSAAEALNEVTT